jgi:hypothetical protein
MDSILKVISTETRQDKRGKDYSVIALSSPATKMVGTSTVKIEPKVQKITKWSESYLPGGDPQFGHDFEVGDKVAGAIVMKGNLLPYPIESDGETRMATSATHVVLGETDDADAFEALVWKEFNSRGKFSANDPNGAEKFETKYGYAPADLLTPVAEAVEVTTTI